MSKAKVLIVLCVTVLFLAVSCVMAGEEYKEDFSKTLPLKAGGHFSLENVNGGVSVSTWKEDKVEIKAVKTARKRQEDLAKVEIRVEETAGGVSVKAVWPKFPSKADVSVEFTVQVPEGVILDEFETVNGSVDVAGRYARAEVGTTNGSVTIKDAAGEFEADTTNGGIHIDGFDGRIEADTTNGNIKVEGLTLKGALSAETTNGSITVVLVSPETLNADLDVSVTNGHITVDFPVTLQSLTGSKRHIEGKIGQGGVEISLHTTNGSITLTK
ncbi:MAG: DUF4097 family beta strand repeat-containing protein [Candidatus Aminicenantes bacterium]|nr:DUF4097 family beta strand repeat-containing protein [Candidatus Aminicenantes bacterium]